MNGKSTRVVKNADEKSIALSNGKSRLSVDEAKAALRGREIALLRRLRIVWPPQKKAAHIHCPIPGHKDDDPSWRWDEPKRRWICTCGSGDIITLIQEIEGLDFPGAMELIADFIGHGKRGRKSAPKRRLVLLSKKTRLTKTAKPRSEESARGPLSFGPRRWRSQERSAKSISNSIAASSSTGAQSTAPCASIRNCGARSARGISPRSCFASRLPTTAKP